MGLRIRNARFGRLAHKILYPESYILAAQLTLAATISAISSG